MADRFRQRVRWLAGQQAGVSLVEVVLAMAVLALVLMPMLNFAAYGYNGQAYERQLMATLAASKLEELENEAYRQPAAIWPLPGGDLTPVGNLVFYRTWTVYQHPNASPWTPERNYMRQVTITVTCQNCRTNDSVTVVTYIAKVKSDATTEFLSDPD